MSSVRKKQTNIDIALTVSYLRINIGVASNYQTVVLT